MEIHFQNQSLIASSRVKLILEFPKRDRPKLILRFCSTFKNWSSVLPKRKKENFMWYAKYTSCIFTTLVTSEKKGKKEKKICFYKMPKGERVPNLHQSPHHDLCMHQPPQHIGWQWLAMGKLIRWLFLFPFPRRRSCTEGIPHAPPCNHRTWCTSSRVEKGQVVLIINGLNFFLPLASQKVSFQGSISRNIALMNL